MQESYRITNKFFNGQRDVCKTYVYLQWHTAVRLPQNDDHQSQALLQTDQSQKYDHILAVPLVVFDCYVPVPCSCEVTVPSISVARVRDFGLEGCEFNPHKCHSNLAPGRFSTADPHPG